MTEGSESSTKRNLPLPSVFEASPRGKIRNTAFKKSLILYCTACIEAIYLSLLISDPVSLKTVPTKATTLRGTDWRIYEASKYNASLNEYKAAGAL
jgi:hypothetical protein